MKFTFRNVGTVKETELDLRPFTAIIGPNNSNKTYLAYLVYAVWGKLSKFDHLQLRMDQFSATAHGDGIIIPTDENFFDVLKKAFAQTASLVSGELNVFFQDSSRQLFGETNLTLRVSSGDIDNALNNFVADPPNLDGSYGGITYHRVAHGIMVKVATSQAAQSFARYIFTLGICGRLFRQPLLMPAERSAFVTTYRMLIKHRYEHLRDLSRNLFFDSNEAPERLSFKEQGGVRHPQPVEDFLDFLVDTELGTLSGSTESLTNNFSRLAEQIGTEIQEGNQTSFDKLHSGGRELRLQVHKGLNIDLYNASSSIKQLTPLVLYLRYRAQKNDLLIIDEPEMNLHPESQAKLMEILAILVNLGVRVLITTHSPYIMAHLNNVRLAQPVTADKREEKASALYLKDPRAFLNPDQVMAYVMDQGKLKDLHDPDYGIRWDTLSDVSADLQQKLFEVHAPDEQEG